MTATTDPSRRPRPARRCRQLVLVGAVVLLAACTNGDDGATGDGGTTDPGQLDADLELDVESAPPLPEVDDDGSIETGTVVVHGLTPGERGLHSILVGGESTRAPVPLGDFDGANAPAVAPDGSTLAAVAWPRGSDEVAHVLVVGDLDHGFEELLVDDGLDMWCVQWFPDGERLLLTAFVEESFTPRLLEIDLDGGVTEHRVDPGRYDCAIPLGGDEVLLTYIGIETNIQGVARASLDTGTAELFYMKPGCMVYGGGIAPGRTTLVTAAACDTPADSGLHLVDLATGEADQLLAGPVAFPSWSPAGEWVVFGLYPDLDSDESTIWAIRPDGSGFRQVDDRPGAQPAWVRPSTGP